MPKHAYSDVVVQTIIADQIFDEPIVDLASKYIKKGTAVLDVGSNFGQMAILFSVMTGDEGQVYAFDADDFVYSVLQKNIEANHKKNIIPNFGAVHYKDNETLYFPVQDFKRFNAFGSYGIDYKNNKGRPVKTLTIDSLNISTPISFMKIDVQGGDLYALQGAKHTILKHKMPIIFEYEYLFEEELNFTFQQYVDFVAEIDYKFERVINGHNFLITPK
ncbi:MAG: FkbM family methyltransferase [Bacteroidia bacterium]|nr:FkbM family methyltransferase [Bacteroidia bacterium]